MPYEADSVPLDGHPMLESFGLPGMVTPEPGGDPFLHPRVHTSVDGDTHFPEVDWSQWQLVSAERHTADEKNDHNYTFESYQKVSG